MVIRNTVPNIATRSKRHTHAPSIFPVQKERKSLPSVRSVGKFRKSWAKLLGIGGAGSTVQPGVAGHTAVGEAAQTPPSSRPVGTRATARASAGGPLDRGTRFCAAGAQRPAARALLCRQPAPWGLVSKR